MVLEVEVIIEDEVLHPIVKFGFHQSEVGIVFAICI